MRLRQVSADLLNYYRNLKSENSSKWLRDTRYKSAQLMHVQVLFYVYAYAVCVSHM